MQGSVVTKALLPGVISYTDMVKISFSSHITLVLSAYEGQRPISVRIILNQAVSFTLPAVLGCPISPHDSIILMNRVLYK
jgi:hypothetical protein